MGKSIFLILISVLIEAIMVWVLLSNFRGEGSGIYYLMTSNELSYLLSKALIGFSSITFFIALIYFVKRVILNQPLLIVDEKGIFDNSSLFSVGQIIWNDIEAIYLRKISGKQTIEIKLRNEDQYITSKFKKFMVKSNKNHGHEVVCINLSTSKEKAKKYTLEYVLCMKCIREKITNKKAHYR